MSDRASQMSPHRGDTPQTALAMSLHRVYISKLQAKDKELGIAHDQISQLQLELKEYQHVVQTERTPIPAAQPGNNCSTIVLPRVQESITSLRHLSLGVRQVVRQTQEELIRNCDSYRLRLNRLSEQQTARIRHQQQRYKSMSNKLIDLQGHIRVFVRIRPRATDDSVIKCLDECTLRLSDGPAASFDYVFGETAQHTHLWDEMHPLAISCCNGYNVTFMSYGQTGSGKTFTMMGDDTTPGLMLLASQCVFHECAQRVRTEGEFLVRLQIVEIYNEMIRDLLANNDAATSLKIRNDAAGNKTVAGAESIVVVNAAQVATLCLRAIDSRQTSATALNDQSSRSHCVFMIHLELHGRLYSTLTLTDLCGSERVVRSMVSGAQLREAGYINRSLSALGNVINALYKAQSSKSTTSKSQNSAPGHVPYRDSVLTNLLQNSLGGTGRTVVLCHLSPDPADLAETQCTLTFAQRVRKVEMIDGRASSLIKSLRIQVNDLHAQLQTATSEIDTLHREAASAVKQPVIVPARPIFRSVMTSMTPSPARSSKRPSPVVSKSTTPESEALASSSRALDRNVHVDSSVCVTPPSTKSISKAVMGTARRLKTSKAMISNATRIKQRKENVRALSNWKF